MHKCPRCGKTRGKHDPRGHCPLCGRDKCPWDCW